MLSGACPEYAIGGIEGSAPDSTKVSPGLKPAKPAFKAGFLFLN